MKVFSVCDDPTVLVFGYDDQIVLDLVAHFLGIAAHDNDNAAPSSIAVLEVISKAEGDLGV